MTDLPRPDLSPEQQRIIERGLEGVAQFEAECGAFTEEELEAARIRYEDSQTRLQRMNRSR